ncbi:hypothetical protein NP493_631g01052 [Ridgeia piscesae]|uniref:Rho guanine nucleotide exchange factor 4 n=1 Tax=Ridgeia piscesae TaxID=27915 RepID=A0AAD9NRL7_RIDPI|nr:hypothetical protein NP493_631g01052 [Ridgeia piscesae]
MGHACEYLSQLGECFLRHRRGFELYSEYCNNHPLACEQLRILKQNKKYQQFFEACRLLQQMIEIPLEGFLLIPVQKICKYPLQLKELLRFTRPHHPDYYCLQRALVCMRRIAALINERKRKMESLQKLAEWQNGVNDWQGTDLIDTSSELIHSGELMKVNSSGWSQDRVFFLFDHQMIYCKKDMLWRDLLIYKGRIDMDNCEVCPIMDGKDAMFNVQVKNAFKVFDLCRHKWYLLQCHTAIEKQQWLEALQLERQRVRSDAENGFNLPDFRSKVAFLHHRQQVCAAGGKLGKGDKRKSMETSTSFSQDMPMNLSGHSSLPRCTSIPSPSKKSGFHPFGRRKGKR